MTYPADELIVRQTFMKWQDFIKAFKILAGVRSFPPQSAPTRDRLAD